MKTINKVRKVLSDSLDDKGLYCSWTEHEKGVRVFVPIQGEKSVWIDIKTESYEKGIPSSY